MTKNRLNAGHSVVLTVLALFVMSGLQREVSGQIGFSDDFGDGDLFDGSPVTWESVDDDPDGTITATDQDVVFTPSASNCFGMVVRNLDHDDVSIRMNFQFPPGITESTWFGTSMRGYQHSDYGNYWAVISHEGELAVGYNSNGGNTTGLRGIFLGDGEALQGDYWAEFAVEGDTLHITAWQDGQPEPNGPQLTWEDPLMDRFGFGHSFGPFYCPSSEILPGTLRSYEANGPALEHSITTRPHTAARLDDRDGDGQGDVAFTTGTRVDLGERDSAGTDAVRRGLLRFPVPPADSELESATLRVFLRDSSGMPGTMSLFHGVDDNELDVIEPALYQDAGYSDTGLDVFTAQDALGQYYDVDVTEFVRKDLATDEGFAVSAFRLQVDGAILGENDGLENTYEIGMLRSAEEPPLLVINFVPEPSGMLLLLTALLGYSTLASRRGRS